MNYISLVPDPPPPDPVDTDEISAERIGHHVDCGGVVLLVGHATDAGRYCSSCGESGPTCMVETDGCDEASTRYRGPDAWWEPLRPLYTTAALYRTAGVLALVAMLGCVDLTVPEDAGRDVTPDNATEVATDRPRDTARDLLVTPADAARETPPDVPDASDECSAPPSFLWQDAPCPAAPTCSRCRVAIDGPDSGIGMPVTGCTHTRPNGSRVRCVASCTEPCG